VHVVENIRQRNENQARARSRLNIVGEACGENDEARHDRNKRVQGHDMDSFVQKTLLFPDIGSENFHGSDADGKSKEGLRQCRTDDARPAGLFDVLHIREQIERQAFCRIRKENRIRRQDDHQDNEQKHHDLRDLFNAFLQSSRADEEAAQNRNGSESHHEPGLSQHCRKLSADSLGRLFFKISLDFFDEIQHKPAGNRRVVEHQQIVSGDADVFVQMPFRAFRLKDFKCFYFGFLRRTADGKFHDYDRQAEDAEKQQIDQYENGSAVLTDNVRKAPDISKSDCTPRRNQNKTQPR